MKRTIKVSVMALVAMFTFSTVADAQFGLGKLAKSATGGGGLKKAEKEANARAEKFKLAIPQPEKGGKPVVLSLDESATKWTVKNNEIWSSGQGEGFTEVAIWNPATLEITMKTSRGGNTPGAVYKVDPNSGEVTDADGNSKGSMSNDGTIISPNAGTLTLKEYRRSSESVVDKNGKGLGIIKGDFLCGYHVYRDKERLGGYRFDGSRGLGVLKSFGNLASDSDKDGKYGYVSDINTNPLLVAFVYYGLILTERDRIMAKLGYDPGQSFTTAQLHDMVKANNAEWEKEIMAIESQPNAGYSTSTYAQLKDCKAVEVGLMSGIETHPRVENQGKWNEYRYNASSVQYYVVYELADGRNVAAFNALWKNLNNEGKTERTDSPQFHEITDWQRK